MDVLAENTKNNTIGGTGYANSYGEVQTGSGPDFPNVNYGVKFLKFDSDLVRGSATFRILHTPPGVGGGGHEIVGIWVKCPNFFWYLVPYGYNIINRFTVLKPYLFTSLIQNAESFALSHLL